jgi:hypothetical protein
MLRRLASSLLQSLLPTPMYSTMRLAVEQGGFVHGQ